MYSISVGASEIQWKARNWLVVDDNVFKKKYIYIYLPLQSKSKLSIQQT